MESTSNAAGVAVPSLLSLLTESHSRHAALALLHERALEIARGQCSLLFELNPASGHLQATSGAGIEALNAEAWTPSRDEDRFVAEAFTSRAPLRVADLPEQMPLLHAHLDTDAAVLVPLLADARRVGMLAIGIPPHAHAAADAIENSDIPAGFVLALELARLRQREELGHEVRDLLDAFADRMSSSLDLAAALEPLCTAATALFAADRTTVWVHDRESRLLSPIASSDPAYVAATDGVRADDPIAAPSAALRTYRAGLATSALDATSTLTVPLRGCRRALGALIVEGVRVEPGDDISLLNRADELGRQLSGAVETTQLLGTVGQARQELEQLFASIAHLIVVIDSDGQIVRANQAFADAVKQSPDVLRLLPLASCVGPELAACVDEIRYPLHQPIEREISDSVLGGPYVVTITDLVAQSGQHAGRVIVARDLVPLIAVREREELRGRLLQSEKLAALGHFVAGIAHELNNPLQSVLGHLELLRANGDLPAAIQGELRTVYRDADRAAKIVRNLLVFAGSGRVQRRRTSLNGILQRVLAQRAAARGAARIEVVRHYDLQLPRIHVDPVLIQQVFLNVLLNAEQAIAATGGAGRIEITTGVDEDRRWVVASVRDTGAGIADDSLPRIFEPFYTTRDVGQGSGLGLALAYGIIQEHGGRIMAANHPQGGAVFTVELPLT
jgi:signal transduction histidine kinase